MLVLISIVNDKNQNDYLMKILYCITGLSIGGAEAVTINIANRMVSLGHQVALIYLTGKNEQELRIAKEVKTQGLNMKKNPVSFVRAQCNMVKFIQMWEPDVIHSQMTHANLFCRLLRLRKKIRFLVCTEHTNRIRYIRLLLLRLTDFLSDLNTNVSKEATQYFIRQKAFTICKSRTVYNGIDLKKFIPCKEKTAMLRKHYGFEENDFVFLNVGRLVPAKNQLSLIMVFHSLSSEYSNVKLLLVGEGILRGELERYITELGLERLVVLAGSQQNITDYYNAADCFVLSSAWEGFGIVLAEAMACELPVIATNSGGCAEVVDDREYIVNSGDNKALFLKMKQIYEMPKEKRLRLGKYNREKAMRFDIENICREWSGIYSGK